MIVGIGIDIVSIPRIAAAMRNAKFVRRILRDEELIEEPSAEWVAGRWAAKEAIAKAAPERLRWHDVLISCERNTPPTATIANMASYVIHLSITHDEGFAAAIAVIESQKKSPP